MTGTTTLLKLALPVNGELDGTWGTAVNTQITSLLDSAVAGTTTLSADADVTLTDTNNAANQSRQAVILWNATSAVTRNITAPARSKPYIVINAGTNSVVLRGAGPTTGITIVSGERCLAAFNGSDFVKVSSTAVSNLTGTLPVANGGTGITSFGAGVATFLGTPTSANLAAAVTNETGSGALVFATSPTLVTPILGIPASGTLTNTTGLPIVAGTTGTLSVARGGTGVTTSTGTGSTVLSASPALTGVPTAPTAGTGTNTTQLATTAYVINSIGAITAGVSTFSAGTTGLTPSTATSGAVTLAGTLAVANGGTGNVNGTVAKLATTNFSVEESDGKLLFKYGATTIASMTSAGVFTALSDITGNGTP